MFYSSNAVCCKMDAMYDVVNESFACAYDSESSDESGNDNGLNFRALFMRNKKTLKPQKRSEVAPAPSGCYWDISSEYFMRALEMKPQTSFASVAQEAQYSPEDIPRTSTLDSFKSVGDLLTLDEDNVGKTSPMQYLKKRVKFDTYLKSLSSSEDELTDSEENQDTLEVNILVVGDHFVGKSAIVRRFVYDKFDGEDEYGDFETKVMNLQGRDIQVNIIDVSGVIKGSMMEEMTGAIIVFDMNDPKSFASVKKWKKELDSKMRIKIKNKNKKRIKLPCVLFANKCDSETTVKICQLDQFCSKKGFLGWFDTSAKDDFNIKNGFTYIVQNIIETYSENREMKIRTKSYATDKKEKNMPKEKEAEQFSTTL